MCTIELMRYDLLLDEQEVKKYRPFVDELRQDCAGQREQQCREHFVTKKEERISVTVWQPPASHSIVFHAHLQESS